MIGTPVQNGIPVNLFHGDLIDGTVTVDLNTNYDHVITGFNAAVGPSFGTSYMTITDNAGGYLFGANMSYGDDPYPERLDLVLFVVLQSLPSIEIKCGAASGQCQLSGYRLAPSADTIFGP